jgi:hypothetical protein
MISRLCLPALLLAVALVGACSALRDDDDDDFIERLDEIVEESWDDRESTDEIIDDLGPPERTDVQKIPNRHNPKQIDEIWTLTYPGLEAKVYKALSDDPKDLLIGLWVSDARYDVGPYFQIGTTLRRIERLFEDTCEYLSQAEWSQATRVENASCDEEVCALRCGPARSTVLLKFTNRRVDRIDWHYYWE